MVKNSPQRIALGIIENRAGQLLIAKRSAGVHLENYWEFPGGRVEIGESFKMALRRELREEIGVDATRVQKIFEFTYRYDDRTLHFQVFRVLVHSSEIVSGEGQPLQWINRKQLDAVNMPPANRSVIAAVQLPRFYMIADYASIGSKQYFPIIERNLRAGVDLIQLRAHHLTEAEYVFLAEKVHVLCEQHGATMICNCDLAWLKNLPTHGVHLTSARLAKVKQHEKTNEFFSASCHTAAEVELANKLNIQCILVGPVHRTTSHPTATAIEWSGFSQLCSISNQPVYALGGVKKSESLIAIAHGGQGIAGIRAFV